jgi:hypothetical protein
MVEPCFEQPGARIGLIVHTLDLINRLI